MNDVSTVTLIVPSDSAEGPQGFQADDLPGAVARLFGDRPKPVPLEKLKESLDRAQGEIDALLADVKESTVGGFHLHTIEVGLTISAEGSIGVATAGVQASLTLSFERTG